MNWYWQCVCDHVWWWFKLFKKLISIQKITVWKTDYTSEVCLRQKLQLYKKYQYLVRKPLKLHFFLEQSVCTLWTKKEGIKKKSYTWAYSVKYIFTISYYYTSRTVNTVCISMRGMANVLSADRAYPITQCVYIVKSSAN